MIAKVPSAFYKTLLYEYSFNDLVLECTSDVNLTIAVSAADRGLWSSGLFIRAPCPRAFVSLRNICCGSVLSLGIIALNLLKCHLSQNFHFYKF